MLLLCIFFLVLASSILVYYALWAGNALISEPVTSKSDMPNELKNSHISSQGLLVQVAWFSWCAILVMLSWHSCLAPLNYYHWAALYSKINSLRRSNTISLPCHVHIGMKYHIHTSVIWSPHPCLILQWCTNLGSSSIWSTRSSNSSHMGNSNANLLRFSLWFSCCSLKDPFWGILAHWPCLKYPLVISIRVIFLQLDQCIWSRSIAKDGVWRPYYHIGSLFC